MILAVWRLERRETLATNNTNITPSFNLQRERERTEDYNRKTLTLSDQTTNGRRENCLLQNRFIKQKGTYLFLIRFYK